MKKLLDHQCEIDSDSPSTTNCSTVVLKDLKHSFSDLGHNFLAFASYSEKRRVGRPLSEAAGNEAHKLGNDDPFSILLRACYLSSLFNTYHFSQDCV